MDHPVIDRFKSLDSAFRARARSGEKLHARFAALAALSAPQDIETLIEQSFETRAALNDRLGNWRAPSRGMRLVFASALTAGDHRVETYMTMRRALNEHRARRGARSLIHGGSCAALAMTLAGTQPHDCDQFFDILATISAPWWRREAAREEVLAAGLTAMGELPDEALARLDRARNALRAAGVPKPQAEAAAFEVALHEAEDGAIANSWTALNTAVRGRSALRHGVGKTGLAILASQGKGQVMADALVRSFETVRELRPRASGQTAARLAMRLAQAQIGAPAPISAARDLAAILAAQAAVTAAVVASTSTAAVTAAG